MAISNKNIVYLLGAGATQAEIANAYPEKKLEGAFWEDRSLLLAKVSKRVCKASVAEFPRHIAALMCPVGLTNIELFISLLEENKVASTSVINRLKKGLQRDIVERLKPRRNRFFLHKALFEFHRCVDDERLRGIISLNYDSVVDGAYESVYGSKPTYCLTSAGSTPEQIPLLKLHGGFDLKYRGRHLPIIAPGVNKNYLTLPYNFVWGRALELLIECDVLRIVGCSLSQNDRGIVDLLFKAHTNRADAPILQIIDFDPEINPIREQFGFFPNIETALNIDGNLIADDDIRYFDRGSNPFKIWLKAKVEKMMTSKEIRKTKYVRKVVV